MAKELIITLYMKKTQIKTRLISRWKLYIAWEGDTRKKVGIEGLQVSLLLESSKEAINACMKI